MVRGWFLCTRGLFLFRKEAIEAVSPGNIPDLSDKETTTTYIVSFEFRVCAVVLTDVFHGVCGPDDLCRPVLPFR